MKKLLFIPLMVLSITSCTSQEDSLQSESDNLQADIVQKYTFYQSEKRNRIGTTLRVLKNTDSRSSDKITTSGNELVKYLTSLTPETVDSLYQIYCTPQMTEEYENFCDATLTMLIELSSAEEVQNLYTFTESYMTQGGHNMYMLMNAVQNTSPIIKECMISTAATIDEYYSISVTRAVNSYCLHMLQMQMMRSDLENDVAAILVDSLGMPGVDVATALVLAGYDLYSAIKLAHEYELCCASHIS